ncbi:hypothetical protein WDU94_010523 [Cyamophila willieti]
MHHNTNSCAQHLDSVPPPIPPTRSLSMNNTSSLTPTPTPRSYFTPSPPLLDTSPPLALRGESLHPPAPPPPHAPDIGGGVHAPPPCAIKKAQVQLHAMP